MQYLVLHTIFNMLEGVLCLKQLENCDVCGWMNVELCEYTHLQDILIFSRSVGQTTTNVTQTFCKWLTHYAKL